MRYVGWVAGMALIAGGGVSGVARGPHLAWVATALLLCLPVSVGTLLWAWHGLRGGVASQLAALLGGTMARAGITLAFGVTLFITVDYYRHPAFLLWLVGVYLVSLFFEVPLLLEQVQRQQATHSGRDV